MTFAEALIISFGDCLIGARVLSRSPKDGVGSFTNAVDGDGGTGGLRADWRLIGLLSSVSSLPSPVASPTARL
jgi:hypothetical protein